MAMGSDGKLRWEAVVYPQGALRILLWDVATRKQGDAAAVASGVDAAGRMAHFLCVIDADGVPGDIVRTNPYSPRHVTFGPQDSIWTFGRNIEADDNKSDYDLFAQYDSGGGLAKTFFRRDAFKTIVHPASHGGPGGSVFLRSASDRIGLYSGQAAEWLEFDTGGNLLGRWPAKPEGEKDVDYFALTASSEVYSWQAGKGMSGLYRFDRSSARWRSVHGTVGEQGRQAVGPLLGADGDRLVLRAGWLDPDLIEWRDAPQAAGA